MVHRVQEPETVVLRLAASSFRLQFVTDGEVDVPTIQDVAAAKYVVRRTPDS